jgi:hypothetical protein
LTDSPALQALQQALQPNTETLRRLTDLQPLVEQQETLRRLTESPTFEAFQKQHAEWRDVVTPAQVEFVQKYENELYEELADAAEAAAKSIAQQAAPGDEAAISAVLFGFESRQILIWRMEGLLKATELLGAAAIGAGQATDNPLPPVLVALIAMLVVTAELLLYLAKGPPRRGEEAGTG